MSFTVQPGQAGTEVASSSSLKVSARSLNRLRTAV